MPYSERAYNRLRLASLVLIVVAASAMGLFYFMVRDQQEQITKQTATIQAQRRETIRRECELQNQRHVRTIKRIKHIIAKLPLAQRKAAQAGEKNTFLIIDTLAPLQNCDAVVAKATHVPAINPPLPTVPVTTTS